MPSFVTTGMMNMWQDKIKTEDGYTKIYKTLHGTSIVCLMRNIYIKGSF